MFDFLSPDILSPYRVTFTDINRNYLNRLESRVKSTPHLRFQTLVDDIEHSKLSADFSLAVAVLVLEHVDWRLAVAALCRLSVGSVFVVIQENPPESPAAVVKGQPLLRTMKIFREVHPMLVNRSEVVQEFDDHGFEIIYTNEKHVPYGKKMVGLGFRCEVNQQVRRASERGSMKGRSVYVGHSKRVIASRYPNQTIFPTNRPKPAPTNPERHKTTQANQPTSRFPPKNTEMKATPGRLQDDRFGCNRLKRRRAHREHPRYE
jgi:hypothetical protein